MKDNKDNIDIKNHFQLIYYAFHRITQKLPYSTNCLCQRIEENNLNIWNMLARQSYQANDLKKIKSIIGQIIHYLSLLAGSQYLPDKNFELLIKEYNKLLTEFTASSITKKSPKNIIKQDKNKTKEHQKVAKRQERIINFLRQREKIAIGEILMLLPQVSKRTIYRDLNNLAQKGILKKETDKANRKKIIFYKYSD